MLDKASNAVLKALNKLAEGTAYKVVTSEEILFYLNRNQFDVDSIKQVMDFLEKQEYINIKFSEENTYCYSLLPKARIYLEQDNSKPKRRSFPNSIYLFVLLASFVGSMLALLIFFYATF